MRQKELPTGLYSPYLAEQILSNIVPMLVDALLRWVLVAVVAVVLALLFSSAISWQR
jgi:hypothetical protein